MIPKSGNRLSEKIMLKQERLPGLNLIHKPAGPGEARCPIRSQDDGRPNETGLTKKAVDAIALRVTL
jgi:hypothetical protein